MDVAGNVSQDAAVLLSIKDAEVSTLRQQMAQLGDDLKRNLAVLSTKDDEVLKLRSTVDALRAVLAEKDSLFAQFQSQVEELEALRVQESAQRVATEQLLAAQQQEWQQQKDIAQRDKDAEIARLQQQLKEAQDGMSVQLMHARQAALDESLHRSTQQQSAIDRGAESNQRLQQQFDVVSSALAVKESELNSAHRQLAAALDSAQNMETIHAKAIAAKEALIAQLQQQLDHQTASISATNGEHEVNMTKLITSLNQMQQSCEAQALEVQEYAAGQKRLQDERRVLKDQLRQQEATITKLQTEKGVLEAALQHEVTAQASAQAQLNIFQAKLAEAVVDLEKKCTAAETRASKLMTQLVEERGRLVDAVIEQANSSTPQLAAELAKSLEADRLRTQTELQIAQERSRSLAEELSLIRSTLLPLLATPLGASTGLTAAAQPANASIAALAQFMQQRPPQGVVPAEAASGAAAATTTAGPMETRTGGSQGSPRHAAYTFAANAVVVSPAAVSSPGCQQRWSPATANFVHGAASTPGSVTSYWGSPTAPQVQQELLHTDGGGVRASHQYVGSARSTPHRGGSLAGLVCELQADVDKLQQQLHTSRRQLQWDRKQGIVEGRETATESYLPAELLDARPEPPHGQHRGHTTSSCCNSASKHHHTHHMLKQQQHSMASPSQQPRPEHASSIPGTVGADTPEQLQNALKYLLDRTEQLSAENGSLKTQLQEQRSASQAVASGSLGEFIQHHSSEQRSSPKHNTGRYGAKNHMSGCAHKAGVNSHFREGMPTSMAAGSYSDEFDSSSVRSGNTSFADDLSIAASEELAAAQAVAAAECSHRHRQARAAPAQLWGSPCQNDVHYSPGRNALTRSSSLGSRSTQSGISSYSTLSPGPGGVPSGTGAGMHNHTSGSSSRQLLETVLASYPHNRLGKLMKELTSTVSQGGSAAAVAAAGSAAASRGSKQKVHSPGLGRNSSVGGASSSNVALAREQLQRLAEMSPHRKRLLRALAFGE